MTIMNKICTAKSIHWLMLVAMLNLSILSPVLQAASIDLDAPSVVMSGQEPAYLPGEGYRVQVVVKDSDEVAKVLLKVREAGKGEEFQTIPMTAKSGDLYMAIVPESLATSADLEYYIEAQDKAGNITQAPYPSKPKVLAKAVVKPKPASIARTVPVDAPPVIEPVVQENTGSNLPELGKTEVASTPEETKSGSGKYILWGVLGALVIGGLAGGGGGGGSGSGSGSDGGASTGGVVDVTW